MPNPTTDTAAPQPAREARVCCLDLDTFFVSVERLYEPSLVGKPVVIGATPGMRGVVTACSYEVRTFGVRSGMPIAEAVRLAPHAVFLPTRHGVYSPLSAEVRAILERFAPVVRPASIDEFYLDFAGCERLYHKPGDRDGDATIRRLVDEIRGCIQSELGLPSSAGIGTSHAIAKIASGQAKPAGTLLVPRGGERAFLWPLPTRKFPGIGPVSAAALEKQGVRTLGELLAACARHGVKRYGRAGHAVERAAAPRGPVRWKAERPAFREHDSPGATVGSISNERTFHHDVAQPQQLRDQLRALAERVSWRARKRGVRARTVTLKLRYADFETRTRARSGRPSDSEADILATVQELFDAAYEAPRAVRLLGVQLSGFDGAARQLELSFDGRPRPKIGHAIDEVRAQFGYDAIRLGVAGDTSRWKV